MTRTPAIPATQRGSIIIVTLWTITLLTILITAMAGQVRLSARVALFHQQELDSWAKQLAALNQAEMELMIEPMPRSPAESEELSRIGREPLFRYNGRELQLAYPQDAATTVRIYDHGGKINLSQLGPRRLRTLLEKKLGPDAERQIADLIDAWADWEDLDDDAGVNGAEIDYYTSLDLPYLPRNGKIETVEELLQVRGFAEVFADVDLDAAFTIYGDREGINLNLATIEAMQLLPGLDDEAIDKILLYRQDKDLVGNGDLAQLIPAENMALVRPWLNYRLTTNYYTIMVHRNPASQQDNANAAASDDAEQTQALEDETLTGFAEIVQISSFTEPPKVLKITPYQKVPRSSSVSLKDETRQ